MFLQLAQCTRADAGPLSRSPCFKHAPVLARRGPPGRRRRQGRGTATARSEFWPLSDPRLAALDGRRAAARPGSTENRASQPMQVLHGRGPQRPGGAAWGAEGPRHSEARACAPRACSAPRALHWLQAAAHARTPGVHLTRGGLNSSVLNFSANAIIRSITVLEWLSGTSSLSSLSSSSPKPGNSRTTPKYLVTRSRLALISASSVVLMITERAMFSVPEEWTPRSSFFLFVDRPGAAAAIFASPQWLSRASRSL